MFGYVIANREAMDEEQRARYKSYYCGICRSLTKNHGPAAGGILSYDMTFLVLVLSSLYEPETACGTERCKPHPVHPHSYAENCFTDYAADMNVLLAYYKAVDDWNDEKKLSAKALAELLKKPSLRTAERYPRQSAALEKCLRQLSELESMNVCDPDAAAKCFGKLMRELFLFREDNWQKPLGDMADALGQFIYILDAFVDLKGDLRHGRYNPLADMRRRGSTDEDIKGVLTMLIGECALNFEKLPLIENVDIMRNILYSGVWSKFPLGLSKKKEDGGENADDK
ncbi:MAG: DUF5685 family protein [Candidatus Heteroscillospira sp.]|jgi:hypothetical protein